MTIFDLQEALEGLLRSRETVLGLRTPLGEAVGMWERMPPYQSAAEDHLVLQVHHSVGLSARYPLPRYKLPLVRYE